MHKVSQPARLPLRIATETAAVSMEEMMKDRPRRLERLFADVPVFFVTFATRDRKLIPALDVVHEAFVRYA